MGAALTGSSIAKRLASCNKTTRDRALRVLKTWLLSARTSSTVTDGDLLKIWEGLFYCVWHADNLPVQVELINSLSSVLVSLDPSLSARYLEAFVATIRREWSGIDHLRLDKFYLLIRRFLHHFFLLLSKNSWNIYLSVRMVRVLSQKSLLIVDEYPAQGVNYHIAEVFLDEIREFLPVPSETLHALLKPFFAVLECSSDKVLINKIKLNIFDRLLENGVKYLEIVRAGDGDVVDSGSEAEKFGKIALAFGLSQKLYDSASTTIIEGNVVLLFDLCKRFLELENDLGKSRSNISLSQEIGGLGEAAEPVASENTDQVEVDMDTSVRASADKPSKKRKKNKKALGGGGGKKSKIKNGLTETTISTLVDNSGSIKYGERLNDSNGFIANEETLNEDTKENEDSISFAKTVITSNLQKQFENVASEAGMAINGTGASATPVTSAVAKKRKRAKSTDRQVSSSPSGTLGDCSNGKSDAISVKKVRFSLKNNLVWKPRSPLPPQSLRIPPSATPRGSALKQGVPPGPIRETPPTTKKIKRKANCRKKARKSSKGVSPAVKCLRKLQTLSS